MIYTFQRKTGKINVDRGIFYHLVLTKILLYTQYLPAEAIKAVDQKIEHNLLGNVLYQNEISSAGKTNFHLYRNLYHMRKKSIYNLQ